MGFYRAYAGFGDYGLGSPKLGVPCGLGSPKLGVPCRGVPTIRIVAFGGLY